MESQKFRFWISLYRFGYFYEFHRRKAINKSKCPVKLLFSLIFIKISYVDDFRVVRFVIIIPSRPKIFMHSMIYLKESSSKIPRCTLRRPEFIKCHFPIKYSHFKTYSTSMHNCITLQQLQILPILAIIISSITYKLPSRP